MCRNRFKNGFACSSFSFRYEQHHSVATAMDRVGLTNTEYFTNSPVYGSNCNAAYVKHVRTHVFFFLFICVRSEFKSKCSSILDLDRA